MPAPNAFRQSAQRLGSSGCSIEMKAIQSAVPTGLKAGRSAPRVINVDKNAASPKPLQTSSQWNASHIGRTPTSQIFEHLIEQDHRFIKRLVKPGLASFRLQQHGRPYRI